MLMASRPDRVRKPSSKRKSYGFSTPEERLPKHELNGSVDGLARRRGLKFAQDDICVNFGDRIYEPFRLLGVEDDGSICSRSSTSTGDSEGTSHTSTADVAAVFRERITPYPTPQPVSNPQTPVRKIQQLPSLAGVIDFSNLPPTPDSLLTTPVFNVEMNRERSLPSAEIPSGIEGGHGNIHNAMNSGTEESEDEDNIGVVSEWEDVDEDGFQLSLDISSECKAQKKLETGVEFQKEDDRKKEESKIFHTEEEEVHSEIDLAFSPKMRQKFVASPELSPLPEPPSTLPQLPSPAISSANFLTNLEIQTSDTESRLLLNRPENITMSTSSSFSEGSPSTVADGKTNTSATSSAFSSPSPFQSSSINPKYRARCSIPGNMPEYADECIKAAYGSRLSPYNLHEGEYNLLREHLSHKHVTTYLNIRNGILRLWLKNTQVRVSLEEAAGCAKDSRFFGLSEFAFEWLERNGYINHGCLSLNKKLPKSPSTRRRRTVAIIGAGISGLATARQLENILSQYGEKLNGPDAPEVVIFEARGRLGGRVYSHYLSGGSSNLPDGRKPAIDVGGQIVMGYDGNPLTALIQTQLGLPYHEIDNTTALPIYDFDGKLIDNGRDQVMQDLHDDILDRLAVFKHKLTPPKTVEGNHDQVNACKDSWCDGGPTIAAMERQLERQKTAELVQTASISVIETELPSSKTVRKRIGKRKASSPSDSPSGHLAKKIKRTHKKIDKAMLKDLDIEAQKVCDSNGFGSLGKSMDEMFSSYHDIIEPNKQDLRLYNWYHANLEYCNASPVNKPSLECWDQDDGNEFTGAHSMIIGGYSQLAKGLFTTPTKLDIRTKQEVTRIKYDPERKEKGVSLKFKDGAEFTADKVIITLPLGVLKAKAVEFDPPLPEQKQSAIDRLGFGLLNKVILVFDTPFWDTKKDGFGCLQQPDGDEHILSNYEARRGRFYMWWNASKVTGRPTLVGLMVGQAAESTENENDQELEKEAIGILKNCFGEQNVPDKATETIVTRWRQDAFARGTYSYIAAGSSGDDYDTISAPINGQIFFAGEHTNRHYPATVHGAYISGLRAASEVADTILGPMRVSDPLILPRVRRTQQTTTTTTITKTEEVLVTKTPKATIVQSKVTKTTSSKRKAEVSPDHLESGTAKKPRLDSYEEKMHKEMMATVGTKPTETPRKTTNPFLIYQKTQFPLAKAKADLEKQSSTGNPQAKAEREEVRAVLGKMWRDEPEEVKKPFKDEVASNKLANKAAEADLKLRLEAWEKRKDLFMSTYGKAHPPNKEGGKSPKRE